MDSKTLALYLGCQCKVKTTKDSPEYNSIIEELNVRTLFLWVERGHFIQPLLRPLSSMTEEEWKEMFEIPGMSLGATSKDLWLSQFDQYEDRPKPGHGKKWQEQNPGTVVPTYKVRTVKGLSWEFYTYSPSGFQYLLSKGFDLFGLIEKGEAIDSTSQPEGNTVN